MNRIEIRTTPTTPDAPAPTTAGDAAVDNLAAVGSTPLQPHVVDAQRPTWLPEKFGTPEALVEAYASLEGRFTQANQDKTLSNAVSRLTDQDLEPISREYSETGVLSDKSYTALEGKGIPREIVDSYVEGQKALADAQIHSVVSVVGGKERYQQMTSWASESLSKDEVDAFDNIIETGNQASVLMAVRGLYARYAASAGSPRLIQGSSAVSGSNSFRSMAEVTAAMRDPRYKADPAYRKDVEDRLRVSDIFGGKQ